MNNSEPKFPSFLVKTRDKVVNFDAYWQVFSFQFIVLTMAQMKGSGPKNMPTAFKPIIFESKRWNR